MKIIEIREINPHDDLKEAVSILKVLMEDMPTKAHKNLLKTAIKRIRRVNMFYKISKKVKK
jgi:hypothetical protein